MNGQLGMVGRWLPGVKCGSVRRGVRAAGYFVFYGLPAAIVGGRGRC